MINLDTTIAPTDRVLSSELEDQAIMMDIEECRYYGLNITGSLIWNMLTKPMVVQDLCVQIATQCEVPMQQCEDEVVAFLKDLLDRRLIRIVATPVC